MGLRFGGTLAGVIATTILVSACGSSSSTGGATAKSGEALHIDLLSTFNGLPFYTATQCGAEAAAKKLGGTIEITSEGPPEGESVSEQLPILASAVNSNPSGIMLVPADPHALIPSVQSAVNRGVPIVTMDQTLAKPIDIANFHTDDVQGGKLGAEELVKLLGGETGSVLVLDNKPGLPVTNERAEGFIAALKSQAGLSVLPTQYNDDEQNTAATQVKATLQAHPDLVGIFATTEAGALGAVSALKTAKTSKVHVVAYDPDPVIVKALREGVIEAAVSQGAYYEGYYALTTLVKHIRGELKGKVKYDNVEPNKIVTKENLNEPSIKPYLYPTKCP